MELIYPFVLYIGIPIIIALIFIKIKNKSSYKKGKKIANTRYVKNIPYFQEMLKKYKLLSYSIKSVCIVCIVLSLIMISRPAKIDTSTSPMYNRDIFLCLDISRSTIEVNQELVKCLKETVQNLNGERFGITIFNTTPVLLVPLTDDYEYVLSVLDTLEQSFYDYQNSYDFEHMYSRRYIYEGTLVGNMTRGSSLIGDGLASCAYNFPNNEKDRTKIIIFSTDNALSGTPIVTLQEAAEICSENDITVFGIAPESIAPNLKSEFKRAVETTDGKLYISTSSSTVSSIVDNIQKEEKSLFEGRKETRKIDKPQIPFILLILSILILFILNKKVKL